MIHELPHVWPWFLVQMYFKNSNRKFRLCWGWGGVAHVGEFCPIQCHRDLLSLNKSILTNPVTLS